MTLHTFAAMLDYFKTPVKIEEQIESIEQLKTYLSNLNPECVELLSSSRFAINEEFVNLETKLSPNSEVFLVPPSSGG